MKYSIVKITEDGISKVVAKGLDEKEAVRLAQISAKENPRTWYYVMDEEELKIHFSIKEEGAYVVH